MKHWMFVTNFLPHVGGLEYYVDDLSKTLSTSWGDEVHVICFDNEEASYEQHERYYVHRVRRVWSVAGVFSIPSVPSLFRLLRKMRQRAAKPDVVWTHTRFFVSSLIGLLYAKIFEIRHIHVEHGSSFVAHSNPAIALLSRIWDYTIGRLILAASNRVVGLSPMGVEFARSLGARRIEFVPCAIEMEPWLPKQEFFEISSNPLLLFVGRLQPGKGVDNLLKALSDSGFSSTRLVVVGDGPARTSLEELAVTLGISERVSFIGKIPRRDIPVWQHKASIFINPSLSEGAPTTVLEALAAGVAVVSTRVGCCEHYLSISGNHGILTDDMSSESIKDAIFEALERFKIQNRAECSKKIQRSFSWSQVAGVLRAAAGNSL